MVKLRRISKHEAKERPKKEKKARNPSGKVYVHGYTRSYPK